MNSALQNGNALLIFFPYPKQDVLQNGIIEQCSMQLCGLLAVVLHGKTISFSSGTLETVFHILNADADLENLSIDSTHIKAHPQSAGAKKGL